MRYRVALACLLLAGCGEKKDAPPPEPAPPVPVPPKPVDAATWPKSGANSAMPSLPRKDWPCRFVQRLSDAPTSIETRFIYGKRDKCVLPVDVVGMRGIVGCPERMEEQNLQNKVQMNETFGYDSDGHLDSITMMDGGRFVYEWNGDVVVSRTTRDRTPAPYASYPDRVVVSPGDDPEEYTVDASGRVVKYKTDLGDTTLTWKGTRLASYEGIGTHEIAYDCKKPPKP